jgi:hypothetical protein
VQIEAVRRRHLFVAEDQRDDLEGHPFGAEAHGARMTKGVGTDLLSLQRRTTRSCLLDVERDAAFDRVTTHVSACSGREQRTSRVDAPFCFCSLSHAGSV